MARLEIGEVLTAGICGVEVQIVLGIVPWNVAARDQIGEGITGCPGKFAGFAKGQDALSVEGDGKFAAKAWFDLGDREPHAGCHGFGDVEMKSHRVPVRFSFFAGFAACSNCVNGRVTERVREVSITVLVLSVT